MKVTPETIAQVDAIQDRALSLGWSQASLYSTRGRHPFPYGPGRGLVCFLQPSRYIGDVRRESIEIVSTTSDGQTRTLRFYNPDVPHPWVRGVTP